MANSSPKRYQQDGTYTNNTNKDARHGSETLDVSYLFNPWNYAIEEPKGHDILQTWSTSVISLSI